VPLIHDHPEFAFRLIDILCEKLRRTNEQVERVTFLDLPTRLAKVLIELAQSGEASAEGRKISVTHDKLRSAHDLGNGSRLQLSSHGTTLLGRSIFKHRAELAHRLGEPLRRISPCLSLFLRSDRALGTFLRG
jgi:CRP-like cAMP-binding protein